jgi:hypothetical protein
MSSRPDIPPRKKPPEMAVDKVVKAKSKSLIFWPRIAVSASFQDLSLGLSQTQEKRVFPAIFARPEMGVGSVQQAAIRP